MGSFKIRGGKQLSGEIIPQGAKKRGPSNTICCTAHRTPSVTVYRVPDILDVNKLIELIGDMGARVEQLNTETYRFTCKDIDVNFLESEHFKNQGSLIKGLYHDPWPTSGKIR